MKRILEAYDESVFNISQNFIRVIFMFDKEMINEGNNEGKNEGKYDGVKELDPDLVAIGRY